MSVTSNGVALTAHLGPAHSDLVYMRPANAIRISKGFGAALLLLPFMRDRHRAHGDAMIFFAAGMVADDETATAQQLDRAIREVDEAINAGLEMRELLGVFRIFQIDDGRARRRMDMAGIQMDEMGMIPRAVRGNRAVKFARVIQRATTIG